MTIEDTTHTPGRIEPEVASLTNLVSTPILVLASLSLAAILLAVVLIRRQRSRSAGNSLLLVGPPDSGKTAILSTLAYQRTLPSYTSLQTNAAVITLPGSSAKALRVVDIPGHPRIRGQFREYLSDARALAFVVDASTVSRNGAVVAEHLHHILHALTSLPPSQSPPKLLILAHKADLLKSNTSSSVSTELAVSRVKVILERELEKRRLSQVGNVGIEGLGEEGEKSDTGGLVCNGPAAGSFKFEEWEGGEVCFAGTWLAAGRPESGVDEKEGLDGLDGLREWLTQVAR
ncbi:hypothetical protein SERLA73DRAFT_189849 [Serpula lacrymans var. lacrymans S7.3]|uniref:Signal recognition particle receptor subunit beta n=2 Tax=Serpula lacrymans var. lacrymans TaxID=341189 RepID=F8QEN6_SERL3|nr:uncharacterized protein SERLADRAFT_480981 [Serpula lacrymans var. lacrymans S7.9]EGN93292.1 hypothetical protein SERLA73DRAFT_189849 [Serpula lacrymans var. lacrymans S7.3]EGO18670.1 hypothetical protein SERLADRAFT_480981 [Serpula lacrymans var. lacrymans S7.9]